MHPTLKHIWYASYGSNLLEERFLCYIKGGKPKGSAKEYKGCTDKSLPIDKEETYICSELYFAGKSKTWDNMGVAFISTKFESQQRTLGRMYLITPEQFLDVVKQETDHQGPLTIDFEKAKQDGTLVFKKSPFYGRLIYLGDQYDKAIFTFTCERDITPTNKPCEAYLKAIISGIQETFDHLNSDEIVDYLIGKKGIGGNYSRQELIRIIES